MQMMLRRRSRRVVAAAMLTALPSVAMANTTYTWSGGNAGTGYFDVGSNWAGNTAPPTNGTSDLVFGSVNLHSPNQPYIEFNYNVSSITFNASSQAYGIGSSNGTTINISSGGITDAATNAESIGVGLVLDTSQTWNVSGSQLTVSNATLNNTSSSVLTKIGGGILNLALSTSTASSIGEIAQTTGTTLITSGTLGLTTTSNYALYVTGGAFNISGGAVVNTSAGVGYAAVIDGGATALVTGSGTQLNTPTSNGNILVGATSPASLNVSSQAVVNCNTDYIGRTIGNSQLFINSGTLNSANTYFGSTTGSIGTGTVTGSGATLNATTLLNLGGGSNGVGKLTISNGGTVNAVATSFLLSSSSINVSQGTLNTGSLSGNGSIMLTDPSGGNALNINGSSGTNTYSGSITGSGTLNKTGGSTQTLSGTLNCGTIVVTAGTLNLALAGNNNAANYFNPQGGLTQVTSGTLALSGVGAQTGIYVQNQAVLNISGGAIVNASGPRLNLDIAVDGGTINVTGNGSQLNGQLNQISVGYFTPGILNVSNGATVSSPTFLVIAGGSSGSNGSSMSILSGGKAVAPVTVVGLLSGAIGTLTVSGTGSTLNAPSFVTLGGDGSVGGTGLLNIANAGVVNAASTAFDSQPSSIYISGGTLNTGSVSSFNNGFGSITLSDPAGGYALNINGSSGTNNYSGSISGSGTLNKSGGATQILALSGTNTLGSLRSYGGLLSIPSGTLNLNSAIYTDTGATLNISGGAIVNSSTGISSIMNGNSTINVTGTNSLLFLANQLSVGFTSPGSLMLSNGGSVNTYLLDVGGDSGGAAAGTGTATISSGSVATAADTTLAYTAGSLGTLTVTGAGSVLNSSYYVTLGGDFEVGGTGILNINSSGAVNTPYVVFDSSTSALNINAGTLNAGYLSSFNTGYGSISLTDPSGGYALNLNASSGTNTYSGTITGSGTLNKSGGSTQVLSGNINTSGNVYVSGGNLTFNGSGTSSVSTLQVSGGSANISAGTLQLKSTGSFELVTSPGVLTVSNGATVTGASTGGAACYVDGNLVVTDPASQFIGGNELAVGSASQGSLSIQNGGAVLGINFLACGEDSQATMVISSGGSASCTYGVLGTYDSANGTATVTGTNSTWNCSGGLFIGGAVQLGADVGTTGLLAINSSGAVQTPITYFESNSATINISGGTLNTGALNSYNFGNGTINLLTNPTGGYALNINGSAGINTYYGSITGNGGLNKSGGSTQILYGAPHFGALNISGGSIQVGGQNNTLAISSLTIGSAGKLNLANNTADISGNSLAAVTALAKTGFAGGAWNGTGGITSSAANSDSSHLTAVGVIQNNQSGGVLFYTGHSFENVVPGAGDILVKYTYYGDTNFDGKVDGSDYTRVDNAYILDKSNPNAATGWFNGDFNYDGVVNGSDYTLIDNAFNRQTAVISDLIATPTAQTATSAVPEPVTAFLAVGSAALLRRRRTNITRFR